MAGEGLLPVLAPPDDGVLTDLVPGAAGLAVLVLAWQVAAMIISGQVFLPSVTETWRHPAGPARRCVSIRRVAIRVAGERGRTWTLRLRCPAEKGM
jgi:hypothetical protein